MVDVVTQEELDALDELVREARLLAPSGKVAELDADIKARAHLPPATQSRFLRRVIEMFEGTDLIKYQPEATRVTADGSRKRPTKTNPWSKEGWNVSAQGKLVLTLGEAKASEIASSAGCKIGSTRFNEDYA